MYIRSHLVISYPYSSTHKLQVLQASTTASSSLRWKDQSYDHAVRSIHRIGHNYNKRVHAIDHLSIFCRFYGHKYDTLYKYTQKQKILYMQLVNLITRFPQSPSLNPFVERLGTRLLSVLRFFVLRPPTCMIPSSPRSCETLLYIIPVHSNLCKLLHVNNVRTCIPEMHLCLIKME